MDNQFIITVIAPECKKETIYSIINQDISFRDTIQVIAISEDGLEYVNEYPDNIMLSGDLDNVHQHILGEYVIFNDCSQTYPNDLFGRIRDYIKNHPEINLIRLDGSDSDDIADLTKDYRYRLLDANLSVIRSDLIRDYTDLDKTVNELFVDAKKCGIISSDLKKSDSYEFDEKIRLFTDLMDYAKDGESLKFIQYAIIDELRVMADSNRFNSPQSCDRVSRIVQSFDDEIIKNHDSISVVFSKFLFYLKTGDFHHDIKDNRLYLKSSRTVVNALHNHKISLDIVDIRNGFLFVSGVFKSSCHPDFIDFYARSEDLNGNNEVFKASKYEYQRTVRARTTYFGVDWRFSTCFDFKIPLKGKSDLKIRLEAKFSQDGDEIVLHPKVIFSGNSYLSRYCSYFSKNSKLVSFKDNTINVADESLGLKLKAGINSMSKIIKSGEKDSYYSVFMHAIHFLLAPFYSNKRIWLFIDRPDVADDNAKHLFSYAEGRDDGIRKYFVLDKDCGDYKKMKETHSNIVDLNSFKYKVLYMFAEKFISSHTAKNFSNPFEDRNSKMFSNLTTVERCLLQHGITIHDVSHWFIKYVYNFALIVTASDLEKASMDYPNLNYDEDVINTLGFPRYDNLNNENLERQILFMPTWRKHITDEEEFMKSDYRKMIEDFLNSKDLLRFLDENDYRVMFKPHYEMLGYVHLLNIPERVILSVNTPYQELFNRSQLLITDYSSVFFDFGYLKKPIIYYRADDEYHNKTGYFDFEKMGFGEIITSEGGLIDKILQYFECNFKMEDEYKKRVDEFFKFTDKNNCKRVYDWLLKNR